MNKILEVCPVKEGDVLFAVKDVNQLLKHFLYRVKGAEVIDGDTIVSVIDICGGIHYASLTFFQGFCPAEAWDENVTMSDVMGKDGYYEMMDKIHELMDKVENCDISEEEARSQYEEVDCDEDDYEDEDYDDDDDDWDEEDDYDDGDDVNECYNRDCNGCCGCDEDYDEDEDDDYDEETDCKKVIDDTVKLACVDNAMRHLSNYQFNEKEEDLRSAYWYVKKLVLMKNN